MKSHIKLLAFCFLTQMLCLLIFTANISAAPPVDFDGDGKTDIAIFRPDNGQWWIKKSSDGSHYVLTFGLGTDRPVAADYTGDGKTDIAVWRPSTGIWYILRSEDFSYYAVPFGISTDKTVPADYDGDGKTDIAVWRESTGTWYIQKSTGGYEISTFGRTGDFPTPADYDGDGKADISVSRTSNWWIRQSSDDYIYAVGFTNYTVFSGYWTQWFPGDFTGDGIADQALYTNSVHNWVYRNSVTGGITYIGNIFVDGLIPVPGDYNGDGKLDIVMYNLNNYSWTMYHPNTNTTTSLGNWGINGDLPVPFAILQSTQP